MGGRWSWIRPQVELLSFFHCFDMALKNFVGLFLALWVSISCHIQVRKMLYFGLCNPKRKINIFWCKPKGEINIHVVSWMSFCAMQLILCKYFLSYYNKTPIRVHLGKLGQRGEFGQHSVVRNFPLWPN